MKVLELFSGTKSIGKAFEKRGHEVFSIDFIEELEPSLCIDILKVTPEMILEKFGHPDIIWASPPCTTFSVASLQHHWDKDTKKPKSKDALIGLQILEHTIFLIKALEPKYFYIENPRGMMRKQPIMNEFIQHTVAYCQYGDIRQKPTDIWTNNEQITFKPMCKRGSNCHEAAPRGSKTGTQGLKNARMRGVIPSELCDHIAIESEK